MHMHISFLACVVPQRLYWREVGLLLILTPELSNTLLLARASEQGNSGWCPYNMSSKKIVIERTRDLIYLKFVATDFFPKIISPSAGENSGDLA